MTTEELRQNLRSDIRALRRLAGQIERGLTELGHHPELARCRARWKVLDVEIDELLGDIRVHRAGR